MNALARLDPGAAMDMTFARADQRRRDAALAIDQERLALTKAEVARGLQAAQDAAAAQREAQELLAARERLMALDAAGDEAGWRQGTFELFGAPLPRDATGRAVVFGGMEGAQAYLQSLQGVEEPAAVQTLRIRAQEAGLQPGTPEYQAFMAKGGSGPEVVVNNNMGGSEDVNIGDVYNPAEVVSTIQLIDQLYTDPSLERITGPIQGGGGNDPEALNMAQRMMAGEQGLGAIAKIAQVQSRGWLAARQMLKGGGPITDYESRKAEAAVARLTRAQGTEEFRTALKDFRDAITEGMTKLQAAGQLPPGVEVPAPPYSQSVGAPPPPADLPPAPNGIDAAQWPSIWEAMPPEDRRLFQ
jgi:hypothetical protein